ncbi:MAG TPA: ATP-binding protein [Polyangiaceae bacterium]|jgi:signal transduction histidine kinase|nr:ATP-binding protein [Polyangiaceae bacterium]
MSSASSEAERLHDQYVAKLSSYVERGEESALGEARELGQVALLSGASLFDLAALHERAVFELFATAPLDEARWQRAARLFRELLTPFDARLSAQRGTNLDRARLEATLARQREALELADAELSAFSRGVSHDLMAPLRSISSFTQEVIDIASAALDLRSRKYLDYVRDAASEMTRQVEGMLALARVSGGELEQSPVDLGSLASEAAQRLLRAEPLRRVEFVLASGEVVVGDPRLLRVVIASLLENAWKFSSRRAEARIEFGVAESSDGRAFFVRDNGAGFDPTLAHKLFAPFQRLHSPREFPGVGVGLALVQRAVRRHGGQVRAEGEVDRGATFYFTLPGAGMRPENTPRAASVLQGGVS